MILLQSRLSQKEEEEKEESHVLENVRFYQEMTDEDGSN